MGSKTWRPSITYRCSIAYEEWSLCPSENDNHPYVALRILRISIRAMVVSIVVAPALWCQCQSFNRIAAWNTHNAYIPVLHHYPQCLHPRITTHNAMHLCSIMPIMPCIITPRVRDIGFYFLQDVGGSQSPTLAAACGTGRPQRRGGCDHAEPCCFSGSLGSSSRLFFSLAPGQMA